MLEGNNPATICENCAGKLDARCTSNDPYSGYVGAFNCMSSGVGDVAFIRHSTLKQILGGNTTEDVENVSMHSLYIVLLRDAKCTVLNEMVVLDCQ